MGPQELEARIGSTVGGQYIIERVLGAGAMGAVYEAVDAGERRVAIKFILPGADWNAAVTARFWRKARVGREISSEHLVPVLDDGSAQGIPYLVMPLLNGHDLSTLIQRLGPLDPSVAVRLVMQAAKGVSAAHAAGVIHRDIKPSNLFAECEQSGEVVVRVGDFGIAKNSDIYDDTSLTRTGASLGSPLYMSPEQIVNAKAVDERSDVWSLCVTLYELLSGTTPFGDAATLSELLIRISTGVPLPLQAHTPWVAPELALAVHQGLQRDPEARFRSMKALGAALADIQGPATRVSLEELRPLEPALRTVRAPVADLHSVRDAEDVAREVDPLLGKYLDEKYRLTRLLGRGGMGRVYEAEAKDGECVAVKILSRDALGANAEGRRRFAREAEAAHSIDSPHVVRIFEVGRDRPLDLPFIAMERLQGIDLAAVLKRKGALVPQVLVRAIIQAASGVGAAHSLGVVHRDIKPANVFLSMQSGSPLVAVKVCDFGIAKQVSDTDQGADALTRTGGMLGSPRYMSPEQAQSAKGVDARSDIWSLGICLFEGLSGRRPWEDRTSLGQIIVAICTAPVPLLQDVAPWISPELAEVVHCALAKDPSKRYPNADGLIAALEPFTDGTLAIRRDELMAVSHAVRASIAPRSLLLEAAPHLEDSVSAAASVRSSPPPGSGAPRGKGWGPKLAVPAALLVALFILTQRLTPSRVVSLELGRQPATSAASLPAQTTERLNEAPVPSAPVATANEPATAAPDAGKLALRASGWAISASSKPAPDNLVRGAPVKAPAQAATLNVESTPSVAVVLDGQPIGPTPKFGLSVAPGEHVLVFVHPTRGRRARQIQVAPGEVRSVLEQFPEQLEGAPLANPYR